MRIGVDCRLHRHAGIGTYIRATLPRVAERMPQVEFMVAINPEDRAVAREWGYGPNMRLIDHPTKALTPLDVFTAVPARLLDTDVLWWPHVNVPRNVHRPLVVTLHDVAPIALPRPQVTFSARIGFRVFLHRVRTSATAIACPSQFTRSEAIRLAGFAPQDLQVVPLGPGSLALRRDASSVNPLPYFLFVGSIRKHKGLATLLDALALLRGRIPHRLTIVGAFEELRSGDRHVHAAIQALQGRVQYLGRIDDTTLASILNGAEALVFPSEYEGFGFPPLEAMSTGVPVIAASAAALPEVLGEAPLWFEPGNAVQLATAMERVATEKDLRTKLLVAGFSRANMYSWDRCADTMAEMLSSAAGRVR
jgi:glycosyltransferase involved in cell wall biosynthesis